MHTGLPTLLYWSLVVGMLISLALAVWLKAWTAAAVVVSVRC